MKHILEADGIILEFGTKRVLQDVFIQAETGKATGILGRNGSGKSCLMNIIFGEEKTVNKSVRINGQTITEKDSISDYIRYLPQFSFIPLSLTIKRIFKDFHLDFSQFAGHFPEFEKFFHTKLKELSGGERRIVEIYSILASKAKFCMLDEPFSQVMPVHVETLKSLINKEKQNKGIIVTDHLYMQIIDVCDDIYVLLNGKTYLIKDPTDLIKLGYLTENNL